MRRMYPLSMVELAQLWLVAISSGVLLGVGLAMSSVSADYPQFSVHARMAFVFAGICALASLGCIAVVWFQCREPMEDE